MRNPQLAMYRALSESDIRSVLNLEFTETHGEWKILITPAEGKQAPDGILAFELFVTDSWGNVAVLPAITRDECDPARRNPEERKEFFKLLASFHYHLYRKD